MPGAFVVLEGGEGAGKSTQCRAVAAALTTRGHEVVLTREPGGTPLGEQVRGILLGSAGMSARTEALLFAAARAEHVDRVVRPALERGAVVLSDRFVDSSVAYQGAARGLGEDRVAELSAWATEGLVPDLTVLLDLDPVQGLRRAGNPNRMEAEPLAFHQEVRAGLRRRAQAQPDRYLVLDATAEVGRTTERILAAVLALPGLTATPGTWTAPDQPAAAQPAPPQDPAAARRA